MKSKPFDSIPLLLFLPLMVLLHLRTHAQVSGISYTLSPVGEYTWWDNRAGLDDGFLAGGKLGIGFGEYLELRGSYMRSLNLKTNFRDFGAPIVLDSLFSPRDVAIRRWGGELKANLSRGHLLPFLTLGTGIQSIQMDTFAKNEHIYINVGAGIVLSLADRYTLTLEARNTAYNFNAGTRLLTQQDRESMGLTEADFEVERQSNWSVAASLQFYLAGRRPGTLSELDAAYFQTFRDGLRGLRVPLEPTLAHVDWHEQLPYRDTWFFGGFVGFDFTPYVGVRGFYLQAMDEDKITTDFDKLALYGGELRLNLNEPGGFVPFLALGGGYLNVGDGYIPKDSVPAESQAFASGAVGLSLPLSPRFKVFGQAKALLTTGAEVEDLQQTDQVQTSWMYAFGLNLTLGKKAERPEAVFKSELEAAVEQQREINRAETQRLRQEYAAKLVELEKQLNEAYAQQDIEKAAELIQEKEEAEQVVEELAEREKAAQAAQTTEPAPQPPLSVIPSDSRLVMTPAEFQLLIEEILENMGYGSPLGPTPQEQALQQQNQAQLQEIQRLQRKIEELDAQLKRLETERQQRAGSAPASPVVDSLRMDMVRISSKLLAEIQQLSRKVDKLENGKPAKAEPPPAPTDQPAPTPETPQETQPAPGGVPPIERGGEFLQEEGGFFSRLTYEGSSGFAGVNLGGGTSANLGFRWHYGIGGTRFEFMPESFLGLGSDGSFGLSLNGLYPFLGKGGASIAPYVGLGGGLMQFNENGNNNLKLGYNLLLGGYLGVGNGRLYVDFTTRNLFDHNQLVAGYRFTF